MSELAKATTLYNQAESKGVFTQKKGGFFSSLFKSDSSNKEDALDLYSKAGNYFKLAKDWKMAGLSYHKAGDININFMKNYIDACQNYVESGNCYKKEHYQDAIDSYLLAIQLYIDNSRLSMAAKYYQIVAEIYDTLLKDQDNACVYYEKAADFFKAEDSKAQANKCSLKLADYSAIREEYNKSIEIYEQIATSSLESNLLKYGVKDYYLKAAVCHLCLDLLSAKRAMENYLVEMPQFQDTREYKLLKSLIEAVENEDSASFSQHLEKYDSISRLDNWMTTLLLRVKKTIEGEMDIC